MEYFRDGKVHIYIKTQQANLVEFHASAATITDMST